MKIYLKSVFSNPTSTTSEAVNVSWPPTTVDEPKVYRISNKLKLDDTFKKESLRYSSSSLRGIEPTEAPMKMAFEASL